MLFRNEEGKENKLVSYRIEICRRLYPADAGTFVT
jgi:hypothetical protein